MNLDSARVDEVFTAAAETTPDARAAFLDAACDGEPELRERVEALLAASDAAGSFLHLLDGDVTVPFAPLAERPGTTISHYKLLEQIGEGGFGVVFMADQERPVRRRVALKIIKLGMDTKQVVARFEAERQALAMMEHPNIATVFDAGATNTGRPYFVMELVRGFPITEYCDRSQLDNNGRIALFLSVCAAVQHAHQKGVIHRDLKPSNVLVTLHDDKAVAKVIDFGVAKATQARLTERTLFTEFHQMVGTPSYMSPEQAQMSGLDVDTRSDVYSLGVLLYELLTGSTPIDLKQLSDASYDNVRRLICEVEPPRPSLRLSTLTQEARTVLAVRRHCEPAQLAVSLRSDLDWIVMKCLEKDRSRRYDSASSLAQDLQRYLDGQPVKARPPSTSYRLRKFVRRYRRGVLAGSIIFLGLILGLALATAGFVQARRQARIATAEAAKATAISNLFLETIQSANPDHAKGGDYTVRQLLDEIAENFQDSFRDEPEVEAAIRATIGNAYRRLGLTDEAGPHLIAALEIRRRELGPDHSDVADSLFDQAFNLFEYKDLVAAEMRARESLAIHRKLGLANGDTIKVLGLLQLILHEQEQGEESVKVAEEALAIAKRSSERHPEVANVLHRMAMSVLHFQDDSVRAERLARQSVEMHLELHGPNHLETGWAMSALATALVAQKKYDEAALNFRRALEIFWQYYDHTHFSISGILRDLKSALGAQKDQAGLAQLEEDVARRLSQGIDANPGIATLWDQRGLYNQQEGHYERMAHDYAEALRLAPDNVWYLHQRGYAYLLLGDHEKSIADQTQCIALGDKRHLAPLRRGQSYKALREFDKAEHDFSRCIELDPSCGEAWLMRGDLWGRRGRWSSAEKDISKLVELEPHNPRAFHLLAPLLVQTGNVTEYHTQCVRALQRFAGTEIPAAAERTVKSCLILPWPEGDLKALSKLADVALAVDPAHDGRPFFEFAKGLVEFRQGNFAAAAKKMEVVLNTPSVHFRNAQASLVLAMARHGMNEPAAARTAFEQGRTTIDMHLSKLDAEDIGPDWPDLIIVYALLGETVALLESKAL